MMHDEAMPRVPREAEPNPEETSGAESRVFPCEGCGADLTFDIRAQSLRCPYCGFTRELGDAGEGGLSERDIAAVLEREAARRAEARPGTEGVREVRCGDCGATVRFVGTLTSTECAYCGTPIQLAGVHDAGARIPVDGVMPFRVTREKARANLSEWVRSRWFAPNDFRDAVKGRFQGVYMPFWTYDAMTANRYRGERGEHYWVTVGSGEQKRRVRKTRWYPASGGFQRFFDDVLVIAGRGLPRKRVDALEPWPLGDCRPFDARALAGFVARTYDVELADGLTTAKGIIADRIRADVRRRIGGDDQRIHSIDTRYGAITYKHLLLPVWMLSYRHREQVFQVLVNAATGEVQGERPWSWVKITLAVIAGLAIAGGVWWLLAGR